MLPFWATMDLGAMAMRGWVHCILQSSSISGTSPSDCLESYPEHSWRGEVLPLCRDAVGVFYSSSWLGNEVCVCVCVWLSLQTKEINKETFSRVTNLTWDCLSVALKKLSETKIRWAHTRKKKMKSQTLVTKKYHSFYHWCSNLPSDWSQNQRDHIFEMKEWLSHGGTGAFS